MSKLEELIREYCPDGAEHKTIRETVGVNRGRRLTKSQLSDEGEYEVYHGSKDSILGKYSQYNAPANTTIVVNTGGIGGVKYLTKPFWCSDGSFWLGQVDNINNKYLYYCLSGYEDYFYSQKRVGGVPTIDRSVVEEFKIPVPPLPVQREIVRILDNFTELAAELAAELTARKRQYEYYKTFLLSFDSDAPKYKLTDIFNTQNGYTPSKSNKKFWETSDIPWFRMEDIRENGRILDSAIQGVTTAAVKGKPFPANSIIVSTSATIGEHALVLCESLANQRFTYLMLKDEYKDKYSIKFLFYYCFLLDEFCKENLNQGNFASVDMRKFNDFQFPMPPLEEQHRIVSILDRFDTLCNDITNGLPDEYYDCVLCPENQVLSYSTTNRDGYREFKSDSKICKNCPSRAKCTSSKNFQKVVMKHLWQDYIELAEDYRHTPKYKVLYALRKETIERVFADAKEKYAMRFTQYRGLLQVTKWVKLKFASMNLKKFALHRHVGNFTSHYFSWFSASWIFFTPYPSGYGAFSTD